MPIGDSRLQIEPQEIPMLTLTSILATVLSVVGFVINALRKKYLREMTLPDGSPTIDESVTRPMLAMARTCAKLCRAIYGRREDLPELLAIDGWKFDRVIASNDLSAVCGIVYRDDGPAPSAIVIWRGTNILNRAQVRSNATTQQVVCGVIPGLVHAGIAEQFSRVNREVLQAIRWHVQRGRKVFLAGHSQGGALATLTLASMRINGLRSAGTITFGSMRVGDEEFAEYARGAAGFADFGHMRFRNNNDIVPLVPPFNAGYCHTGEELYIWPGSMITKNPGWLLSAIQRIKPMLSGVFGDGIADHSMDEYCRHLDAVRI
jgi:hypothetical protein